MQVPQQSETVYHRLIVLSESSTRFLALPAGERFRLPSVLVSLHHRIAEQLTVFLQEQYSLDAACLFKLDIFSGPFKNPYYVVEARDTRRTSSPHFRWLSVSDFEEYQMEEPADCLAISNAVTRCKHAASSPNEAPFATPGWRDRLTNWIQSRLLPLGMNLSGRFTQINASPTFCLARFETDGPAVWFKAVGPPNLREYPVTMALSRYFPGYLPHVVAALQEWNGWLATEAQGAHPTEAHGIDFWTRIAAALAELQVSSFGQTLHLLDVGCLDARSCALGELCDPFFAVMMELAAQTSVQGAEQFSREDVLELSTKVRTALRLAADSEMPNTIDHLDFNPGNVIVGGSGCVFLDWAEGAIGHPFLTLQYLLVGFRRFHGHKAAWERSLVSAYIKPWQPFVCREAVRNAMRISPLLAMFAHAACGRAWRDPELLERPEIASHLRKLLRRMKRETDALEMQEVSCIS